MVPSLTAAPETVRVVVPPFPALPMSRVHAAGTVPVSMVDESTPTSKVSDVRPVPQTAPAGTEAAKATEPVSVRPSGVEVQKLPPSTVRPPVSARSPLPVTSTSPDWATNVVDAPDWGVSCR